MTRCAGNDVSTSIQSTWPPPVGGGVEVVDDVEQPESPAVPETVMPAAVGGGEVDAPDLVRLRRHEERLLDACREPFSGSAPDVQLHRGVDAVDPLVIPRMAGETEPVVGLPEADRWMPLDEC